MVNMKRKKNEIKGDSYCQMSSQSHTNMYVFGSVVIWLQVWLDNINNTEALDDTSMYDETLNQDAEKLLLREI